MLKIDFSGLEELERNLNRLSGLNNIKLSELLSNDFMKNHTKFASLDNMFDGSPFTIESKEDFEAIDDIEWDNFINDSTSFKTWQEMQEAAVLEWTKKQLNF